MSFRLIAYGCTKTTFEMESAAIRVAKSYPPCAAARVERVEGSGRYESTRVVFPSAPEPLARMGK